MKEFFFRQNKGIKVALDSSFWIIMTLPAYWLRIESDVTLYWPDIFIVMGLLIPLKLLAIYIFGHHRRSWRYSSISDLLNLTFSVFSVTALYFALTPLLNNYFFIPMSVPLIEGLLTFLVLGGGRFTARLYLKESYGKNGNSNGKASKRVLIAGAGDSGTMIVREMKRNPEAGLKPVVFLDDNPVKWNQKIMGIPVEGRISEMTQVVQKYNIDEVIIAMPSESGEAIRNVVDMSRKAGVSNRILPAIEDLISGKVNIGQLREVDVEDLLRRKPVELNTDKIEEYLTGKRIMVTGAGGSIGSEITRQISRFKPDSVTLIGRGENSIYLALRELKKYFEDGQIKAKIADVRDIDTMDKIFNECKPEVLFHAAAHKHVPLMEENPSQAIFNNVGGTKNLVDLALEYDVERFVNISTDKAVNPTSIMGASKRAAEYVVQNAASKVKNGQQFVSVRFGNVLGSRGSVVPIFKEQIKNGGPLTITHPDMKRYFMTIPEASQLVLQAGALKQNGAVFVLDMGKPIKIVDMAKDLIKLSGLTPGEDIEINFTGIRSGEKLFEELLTAEEGTDVTKYEKIMVARNNGLNEDFEQKLGQLFESARQGNENAIRSMLHDIVPTYGEMDYDDTEISKK